jgi:hypothetical protein
MKPGEPGIRAQQRRELQVDDLRPIPAQQPAEIPDRLPPQVRGVGEHLNGNIWPLKIQSHGFGWRPRKTKHTLPPVLRELRGQLASKHLNSANPKWLNVKEGEYGGIHRGS